MLKRAIHSWERKLSTRDTNRVIRPFEWGVEFLEGFLAPGTGANSAALDAAGPREVIFDFNARAIGESERFFEAGPVSHFDFDGHWLAFKSPVSTPYVKNNTAYARYFPVRRESSKHNGGGGREAAQAGGRAVLVLSQMDDRLGGPVPVSKLLRSGG